jgi:hypothetical protein
VPEGWQLNEAAGRTHCLLHAEASERRQDAWRPTDGTATTYFKPTYLWRFRSCTSAWPKG